MIKIKICDCIFDISLVLFNSLGEFNVIILLIFDEMDISLGNFYYYFKSKGDIVEELFQYFEQEVLDLFIVLEDVDISLDQQSFFLYLLFEIVVWY